MTRSLAIDPGGSTGWALYEGRTLVACGACAPSEVAARVSQHPLTATARPWVDRLLVEKPQKYPHDNIDPNDLITLALRAGIAVGPFVAAGAHLDEVLPKAWKGNLPKSTCHGRSWAALSPAEQAAVTAGGRGLRAKDLLDLLDAVALGQWALGSGPWRQGRGRP